MKLIYAGPSLHGSRKPIAKDIECRTPASQGDITRAVREGANVIGLIDGLYENVAAVWHKEILFALAEGVQVFGAASLGALRAVECASFGMIGIGEIFQAFRDGRFIDDSEVALLHGPKELNYLPLSEPLVNVRATAERLAENSYLTGEEHDQILDSATRLFFKERTWKSILAKTGIPEERAQQIKTRLGDAAHNQKRIDAEQLIDTVEAANDVRIENVDAWDFARTSMFERWLVST